MYTGDIVGYANEMGRCGRSSSERIGEGEETKRLFDCAWSVMNEGETDVETRGD